MIVFKTCVFLILVYLVSSFPSAFIFAKKLKGIDIREVGSGNVGATNAARFLGKGWGVCILFLDAAKGFIGTALLYKLFFTTQLYLEKPFLPVLAAIFSVAGHNWPVYLRFRGGKGVAVTLGVLLGLALLVPKIGLALGTAFLVWLGVFLASGVVSLASLVSAFSVPVMFAFLGLSLWYLILGILLCISILIRHKDNIRGLITGEELKDRSFRKS